MIIRQTRHADMFRDTVRGIRGKMVSPLGLNLHVHSLEDYENMRLFLNLTRSSGFAINGDELVNLFSLKKNKGDMLVQRAIGEGARRLDCYDGYLVRLYQRHGFDIERRVPWDDAYTPAGWNTLWYGRPEIVFMRLP